MTDVEKFQHAVSSLNLDEMETCLKCGINPDVDILYGRTALHITAAEDSYEATSLLLNYGANPDIQDNIGDTPLMYSSFAGNIDMVRLFILKGANLNIRNKEGMSAASWALTGGFPEICELLKESGAEDPYLRNGLQNKISNGLMDSMNELEMISVIEQRLSSGESINHQDIFKITALMLAADRGLGGLVKLLLKYGADPSLTDQEGVNALEWARENGDTQSISLLEGKNDERR